MVAPADPLPSEMIPISLDARLVELETTLIAWALNACGGNQTRAAALLQIRRSTLQDRIVRCQDRLVRPDTRDQPAPVVTA